MGGLLPPSHDGCLQRRLPMCRDASLELADEILPAALDCSLAFGSELLASARRLRNVVLSFLLMDQVMGLPCTNSLGAVGSLRMLSKSGKVTRGTEQLSFTAFALRSIFDDVISITGVLVYVLLVSSVAFAILLERNSAQDCRALGIAAMSSFRLLLGDFDPEVYVDCQNATAATVVFLVFMWLVIIVLLNMLIALMTGTWTPQQSERAVLGLRGGAQLLNECEARMNSKASARADWFPKCMNVINEAPKQEVADGTAPALQLQVIVQGRTRMIDAWPTTTAAQLEHMVAERVGIDGFALYYRGRPLHSTTALSNYGLTSGATIELKERGRGGGCSQSKSSTVGTEHLVPPVEARRTSHITHALRSMSSKKVMQGKLAPYDFESLWAEKRASHLQGTREWAFEEIEQWRTDESASKLFWLMGGGGVGKSVLSAELLARWLDKHCVAAWHFCRHDDTEQSKPANLLRSIAAMLCHTLDGFEEALNAATGIEDALVSADPIVVFDVLIQQPIGKVPSQTSARVIIIDALDEIPKEGQKPLLGVIVSQLASLPGWLRVFVTSREQPLIQKALSAFRPKELRADEAKNRADVEVFLRAIAREHVKGQANMSDVVEAVERQFKIKLPREALSSLQEKMDESRAIYDLAARKLTADPKLRELERVNEMREPKPKQQSSEFETIYGWAERAQRILEESVASEWEEDHVLKWLKHPMPAAKKIWVFKADSPGVKGKDRAAEKCQNDYDGDAAHLKDVARLTLLFHSCQQMIDGLQALRNNCGFKLVALKNKFAHPTPMGYRDLNLCVEVPIDEDTRYTLARLQDDDEHTMSITFAPFSFRFVCEVQINHSVMIEAKAKAHRPYEHIRSELPKLCKGTGVDADKLEAFIVGQLNSSALDVAVSALSAKAQGLFLYAFMLQQYLDSEAKASRTISFNNLDALPAGLDDVYAVNFRRAFPADAPERWVTAKPLLELVAASMEPISVAMAAALLRWTVDEQERVLELTALLFPVRDGLIHVFHKTVVDWITGDVSEGSSIKSGASEFRVKRDEGHRRFAEEFTRWLQGDTSEHYWLKHGIVHLCRAGRADDAVRVYSSDLSLLRRRLDAGLLGTVSTDCLELCRYARDDLKPVMQMKSFVAKSRDVFERERGFAVTQLASQQPDESVVFRALAPNERYVKWRNKPQTFDPCIATLSLSSYVAALSISQKRILGGAGQSVYVYDAATEELLETLECGSPVKSVAIYEEPEAGSIAAALGNGGIKVWDSATLELKVEKCDAYSCSVGFSPDGNTIVSTYGLTIKVLDSATLELKAEKSNAHSKDPRENIISVAFSPDGKTIVSVANDMAIKIWDSATLELMSEKSEAHSKSISSVAFSPNGTTIVSGAVDKTIRVWDLRPFVDSEWEEVDISALKKLTKTGRVKIDGLYYISTNYWRNTITGALEKQKPKGATLELKSEKSHAHLGKISSVAFSPDGSTIVSTGDLTIKAWNSATLEPKAVMSAAYTWLIESVAFSADSKTIVSSSFDKIQVWDAGALELKVDRSHTLDSVISAVAFSPDGNTIISSSSDRTIKIWDSATLELKSEKSNAHRENIKSVAFSSDGKTIASGDDSTIKVWDFAHSRPFDSSEWEEIYGEWPAEERNGKIKHFYNTITGDIRKEQSNAATLELKSSKSDAHSNGMSVNFSPDGKTIVSGGTDSMIKIWVAATLELTAETKSAHESGIFVVAYSPDGKTIVSGGSFDSRIQVWDSATLELKAEKRDAHRELIQSVAFSADSKTIVSGAHRDEKMIKIWDAVNFRPHVESEWKPCQMKNRFGDDEDGWENVVTGYKQETKPSGAGTLQLIEERPDKSGHVVDPNDGSLRFKGGDIAFYAPIPITRVAKHENRIAAGAQSGQLYHLEVI